MLSQKAAHCFGKKSSFAILFSAVAAMQLCRTSSASMTISLQFPNGSTNYNITPADVGTSIPIQVWASITTTTPVTPGNDTATGIHDGLQYAYYAVESSVPLGAGTAVDGQITNAALDTSLGSNSGFGAYGSQNGYLQDVNADGVTDVGRPGYIVPTSLMSTLAKCRSASPIWDDAQYDPNYENLQNAPQIVISNNDLTVSFLIETLDFSVNSLNGQETVFSPEMDSLSTPYVVANWFEDVPNEDPTNGGFGGTQGTDYVKDGPILDGTSVTFTAPNTVPEPASASLLLISTIAMLTRRRRRN